MHGSINNKSFTITNIGVANIEKVETISIKYMTCLKLKYPPKIFSSLFTSNGTLNTLIILPPNRLVGYLYC